MAIWNSQRDQRLLLLIVDTIKPDTGKLAEAWKTKFAVVDDYTPTPRAISEHLAHLRKTNAGTETSGTKRTKETPVQPKRGKLSTPCYSGSETSSPTGGAKRKRTTKATPNHSVWPPTRSLTKAERMMCDTDDDDDDDEVIFYKAIKREPEASITHSGEGALKSSPPDHAGESETNTKSMPVSTPSSRSTSRFGNAKNTTADTHVSRPQSAFGNTGPRSSTEYGGDALDVAAKTKKAKKVTIEDVSESDGGYGF